MVHRPRIEQPPEGLELGAPITLVVHVHVDQADDVEEVLAALRRHLSPIGRVVATEVPLL